MHPEIDVFVASVKNKYPDMFNNTSVLEIGSQNINGTVRSHFTNCDYIGTDLGPAKGVDVVHDITTKSFTGKFDVVISSEMLEHCKDWEKALINMYNNVKKNGLFILTCAAPKRQEHGTHKHTPQDSMFTLEHYRNISVTDFDSILPAMFFNDHSLGYYRGETDLYFWGICNKD
jgi:SAM-dependent methyltransferase